ncbi:hypothetical protein STEG23_008527 [Scotinomys teguina]
MSSDLVLYQMDNKTSVEIMLRTSNQQRQTGPVSASATLNGFDFAANVDADQGPPEVNIQLLCIWGKGLPDHEFSEVRKRISLILLVHMWLVLINSLSQHHGSRHCSHEEHANSQHSEEEECSTVL